MKLNVKKFLMGGSMQAQEAPEQGAPMEGETPATPAEGGRGQEEAMQQLAQLAQQIIQQIGPDAAMALAQMIIEMLQGGQNQLPAPEEQPTFQKRGGVLYRKN